MKPSELKKIRREQLKLTQAELAVKLGTTRVSVARYESGARRIPGVVEVAVAQFQRVPRIPMLGIVAAGKPIEPVGQKEFIDLPLGNEESFALRVEGESMREEGIMPGDLVIVRRQARASAGQTVVALVNGEATVKKYFPKADHIELRPANAAMQPIRVTPEDKFELQGVVVGLIRHFK
ncbi:MAG TPA: S24 family peptidase [Verrucomicrobiae bacterium]|jgi:repressor LexA|nr:S24 family peptidase [Verrucomicrobiae bacterium]